ncbi:hypothetical protein [Nocardia sp. CA-120079]|uniref:hypothetical protein n=1 Tax=Nocardia sp. CA-120079 TaxID=3239974 RepID=UPI003D96EBDA
MSDQFDQCPDLLEGECLAFDNELAIAAAVPGARQLEKIEDTIEILPVELGYRTLCISRRGTSRHTVSDRRSQW